MVGSLGIYKDNEGIMRAFMTDGAGTMLGNSHVDPLNNVLV